MPDENKSSQGPEAGKKGVPLHEGYQSKKGIKGYQPVSSNLNSSRPPQGGSGVPAKNSGGKAGGKKE